MHIPFFDRHGVLFDQPILVSSAGEWLLLFINTPKNAGAILVKRQKLHNSEAILQQDNTRSHRKREALGSWNRETLPHPPYWPDIINATSFSNGQKGIA